VPAPDEQQALQKLPFALASLSQRNARSHADLRSSGCRFARAMSTLAPPTGPLSSTVSQVHAGCKQNSSSIGAVDQTAGTGAKRSRLRRGCLSDPCWKPSIARRESPAPLPYRGTRPGRLIPATRKARLFGRSHSFPTPPDSPRLQWRRGHGRRRAHRTSAFAHKRASASAAPDDRFRAPGDPRLASAWATTRSSEPARVGAPADDPIQAAM
jgi:hypothetical protein